MAACACRVCSRDLFGEPLLRYGDMPKAAQHLPDAATLEYETGVDLEVWQCTGCGLVQLRNDPVPYYREVIRAAAVSDVLRQAKAQQFARFVQQHALRGKRVLEVGCGRGELLSLLPPLEVMAFGLEYSESAVAECVKDGLRVSRGYPDRNAGALPGGPFDAFLLLMFLEHMPEPGVALRVIHDNVTDDAVGLIEVPNFDMVLRKKLFAEFIGDHLLYFTQDTLRTTLHVNGFDVVESSELRDEYVISVIARKRGRLDVSDFHAHQERITFDIGTYVSRFGAKRVAVWGAGHQALAVLALTGVADRIRYVVDSAPFKQGKYTPATHLPIVAPEVLQSDPVDAVIVMAASYSDEVAGIIRQRFGRGMSVAILRDFGLEITRSDPSRSVPLMPSPTQPHVASRLAELLARQEIRYLIAGGWNTAFGYGVYAGLLYLFQPWAHYMAIAVVGSVLAITMAYATHKLFVFRTKGNVIREYLKFYGVYGVSSAMGLVALPVCVEGLGMSPYVAPLLILGITVVASYFAHKHFSFK